MLWSEVVRVAKDIRQSQVRLICKEVKFLDQCLSSIPGLHVSDPQCATLLGSTIVDLESIATAFNVKTKLLSLIGK